MKSRTLLLLFLLSAWAVQAQTVVINEFLTSNTNDIVDNKGEKEDWIEVFNTTSSPYNLAGMFISDDLNEPLKWQIPVGNDSTIIPAGGYLVLFADKDPEQGVLHLDFRLSVGGEQLGLFDGLGNAVDTFTFPGQFTDVSYGRNPDGTSNWVYFSETTPGTANLQNYLTATLVEHSFPNTTGDSILVDIFSNVNWTVSNPVTWLSVDPVSGSNNGQISIKVIEENSTNIDRTATVTISVSGLNDQGIVITQLGEPELPNIFINEIMCDNVSGIVDNKGENDDWIEIYNPGTSAVDIGGLFITDDLSDPTKYQIPATQPDSTRIGPGGFLLLWADNDPEQGVLHLDFALNNGGEEVGIYYSQFSVIDQVAFGVQQKDTSYGRVGDGLASWVFFSEPTPGFSNNMAVDEYENKVVNVFPNPCTTRIYFNAKQDSQSEVFLFTTTGELVLHSLIEGHKGRVNVEKIPAGIYILQLKLSDFLYHQKVVIQK